MIEITIYGVTGDRTNGILNPEQQTELDQRQKQVTQSVLNQWMSSGFDPPYPLVAMPTGFGKSRVIHQLLTKLDHEKILLIVGTKSVLLDQSYSALKTLVQSEAGTYTFSLLPDTSGQVVLTTWQGLGSIVNRGTTLPTFGLVVVDEVHNTGTSRRIGWLNAIKPESVVGLTATAYRSTGSYRAPNEYGFSIVDSMPLPACIRLRWLSPLMGIAIDTHVVLPAEVKEKRGINLKKVEATLRKHPEVFRNIANEISQRILPTGAKTLVIVNRINEEACVIAKHLQDSGYKVGLAIDRTHARRLKEEFVTLDAIERYNLPEDDPWSIQVLISPQVVSEGFDAPATECIVWAAPTASALRYTQVVGRGARRCPGKKYCLVIDFVYMIENYGYSYNFSQFVPKEELKELGEGVMYLGPDDDEHKVEVPAYLATGGKFLSVIALREPITFCSPAADWITLEGLAPIVRKSPKWILPRLEAMGIVGQERLDVNHRPRTHYPPEAVDKLLGLLTLAPIDDWLTERAVAVAMGWTSHKKAKAKLAKLSLKPQWRLTKTGHKRLCFPPSVLELLKKDNQGLTPAGDLLTVKVIANQLGRSCSWVISHLPALDVKPEARKDSMGRDRPHYPPWVIDELKRRFPSRRCPYKPEL